MTTDCIYFVLDIQSIVEYTYIIYKYYIPPYVFDFIYTYYKTCFALFLRTVHCNVHLKKIVLRVHVLHVFCSTRRYFRILKKSF